MLWKRMDDEASQMTERGGREMRQENENENENRNGNEDQ